MRASAERGLLTANSRSQVMQKPLPNTFVSQPSLAQVTITAAPPACRHTLIEPAQRRRRLLAALLLLSGRDPSQPCRLCCATPVHSDFTSARFRHLCNTRRVRISEHRFVSRVCPDDVRRQGSVLNRRRYWNTLFLAGTRIDAACGRWASTEVSDICNGGGAWLL